jgi:hypothetical protein
MEDLFTLAKQLGPWAAVILLIMWRVGVFVTKIVNKVIDRHLAAFDNLGQRISQSDQARVAESLAIRERLHFMAGKIQEHAEADAQVLAEIKSVDGRLDGLVEAFEAFTPLRAVIPPQARRRQPADQEDTPVDPGGPVGIARRVQTPARGVGTYKIHRRDTNDDDSEG